MAIGIDDIDEFEPQDVTPQYQQTEPDDDEGGQQEGIQNQQNDSDEEFLLDFLKSKGIDDPSRIKFEDESGNIQERNWNDLSRDEQINILNTPLETAHQQAPQDLGLTDEEIQLLNTIRQANMTPSQYISQFQQPAEPTYRVDDLSDDELYLLDLESRVGELTDDEAAQALSTAKQNESFYQKQVEGIRKEYKEREDYISQQEQADIEQQQQEAFAQYQNQVVNAIDSFNSIGNLDLNFEDADKEELAEFMLSQDESGNNYLYQALQDPQTLVKAAWFILNGDEAFDNITDYFKNQIKLVSENQYKKGFEEGKKGKSSRPSTVIFTQNNSPQQREKLNSIDMLD